MKIKYPSLKYLLATITLLIFTQNSAFASLGNNVNSIATDNNALNSVTSTTKSTMSDAISNNEQYALTNTQVSNYNIYFQAKQ